MTTTVWNKNFPLNELFSLPISAHPVASISGVKLFSSSSLPKDYINAMGEQSKTKEIATDIERLVNKKKIIPCWLSSGVYSLIKHKVFGESEKHIMGFFSPQHNKIFLLMDNNITFGYASNLQLANLTLHEGCHMASAQMKDSFLSLFKSELTSYYSELIKSMFALKTNVSSKEIQIFYNYIYDFELNKNRKESVLAFLRNYYTFLIDTFSKYSTNKEEFNKKAKDVITFLSIYLKGDVGTLIASIPNFRHVIMPLYNSYKKGLGATRINSICIQELMIPSEVICVYSEFATNLTKIHQAFKKIK